MGVYIPRLPNAYQEVEYIQSSGTQYINTGYTGSSNTKIDTKLSITTRVGNYDFFYGSSGNGTGGQPCTFIQYNYPDNNKIRVVNYANSGSNKRYVDSINNLEYGKTYNIIHTNTSFIIDGVSQGTMSATTYTLTYPFWIFGVNNRGSFAQPCAMKLYSFKIYESGTLVIDFIPCYRKSDNVIGLYDIVNNQFYTNSGTGTFSKGADVTAMPLKNAYIGEVYEYSYDFRNKTWATCQADGWTIVKGTPSFGTYGVYGSDVRLTRPISLTAANKLSLEFLCTSYTGGIGWRVAASVTSSGSTGSTGSYMDASVNKREVNIYGTTSSYSGLSNGTYTQKVVFDFVNKTYTLTTTGKSDETGTLTDTQISNIKNNITVVYCYIGHPNSNGGLATIKVTVE